MKLNFVDTHSSGAPCRVIIGGIDELGIVGATMLAKKLYFEKHFDWLRRSLLTEPRGAPIFNADLVVPPCDPAADIGLLILNQRPIGPMMSGGNILAFVTAVLESGVLPIDRDQPTTTVRVDTPGGIVVAHAACKGRKVLSVAIENVPSFATHLDERLEVPGIGIVDVDVAYGGMYYVLVSAERLGLAITPANAFAICQAAEQVRAAAAETIRVDNPASPSLKTVDAVLVYGAAHATANSGRSAVVMPLLPGPPTFADGVTGLIDRCPCGTGTSAQVAALVARGQLMIGEEFRQESIIDGVYKVTAIRTIDIGSRKGIIPKLVGSSHVFAEGVIHISDDDPLRHGFTVGDMWPAVATN